MKIINFYRNDVGNGPVRLLRRPNSGSQIKYKTDEELAKEADEKFQRELEQRAVAYQQAREKIFGDQSQNDETPSTETDLPLPVQPRILSITMPSTSGTNTRDHLSDVPMKKADVNRQQQAQKQVQSFQNTPQPLMMQPIPPVPPHLAGAGPWPNFNYGPPPNLFIPPQNMIYNGMPQYYGPVDPFLPNPLMRMPTPIIPPPQQRPYQNQSSNTKDRNRRAR